MRLTETSDISATRLFAVDGLVTIVTGGASGLGFAFAEVMAVNGAEVVLLDFDPAKLDQAVATLSTLGGKVSGVVADVTDRPGLRAAIDTVALERGRLDVVFANAGISAGPGFLDLEGQRDEAGAIENVPDDLWDKVIATNLTSVMSTVQASAPHMKKQGSGRIIATASIAGLRPGAVVGTPYGVSKAGIAHLVKQAGLELARYGVTVNAICPGPFLTPLTPPDLEAAFSRGSPLHRVAQTREIQGLALFLASPASSYVTGAHLVIDGGSMLGRAD
jgi:NAD(P)-dependent dehydrogenase (short-subunit alcohol dehydrogenase family)